MRVENPLQLIFFLFDVVHLLEWALPEKWGKHSKSDIPRTGGVLVIGERTKEPENSCAATIKARQWKSRSREIEKAKS